MVDPQHEGHESRLTHVESSRGFDPRERMLVIDGAESRGGL